MDRTRQVAGVDGQLRDAYYAFTRAYELDRSNPDVLRAVTELALRSGDISLAQSRAKELEIVAPGDPLVKLTQGWAAVSQSRYAEAVAAADALLATSSFDPAATVLKGRGLMGLRREGEAKDLLVNKLRHSLRMLEACASWPRFMQGKRIGAMPSLTARRLSAVAPKDRENSLMLIEAALRSGDIPAARGASAQILSPDADPMAIASVLDLWERYWQSPQRVQDARALASAASGLPQKLVYASFLSRVGAPADAIRIAAPAATLPLNAGNAQANAVLAEAWLRSGNLAAAKSRLDAVIAFDSGNATALRSRAELELRTGHADDAVIDAQKLVTVLPDSAPDRLLLARCFTAAGKPDWARRTLWTAFQDIPGDEQIYEARQPQGKATLTERSNSKKSLPGSGMHN